MTTFQLNSQEGRQVGKYVTYQAHSFGPGEQTHADIAASTRSGDVLSNGNVFGAATLLLQQ